MSVQLKVQEVSFGIKELDEQGIPYTYNCYAKLTGTKVEATWIYSFDAVEFYPTFIFDIAFCTNNSKSTFCSTKIVLSFVTDKYRWLDAISRKDLRICNFNRSISTVERSKVLKIYFDIVPCTAEEETPTETYGDCTICNTNANLIGHTGCSHVIMCNRCIANCFVTDNKTCPVCRAPIGNLNDETSIPHEGNT
jgi:hypothetical protein